MSNALLSYSDALVAYGDAADAASAAALGMIRTYAADGADVMRRDFGALPDDALARVIFGGKDGSLPKSRAASFVGLFRCIVEHDVTVDSFTGETFGTALSAWKSNRKSLVTYAKDTDEPTLSGMLRQGNGRSGGGRVWSLEDRVTRLVADARKRNVSDDAVRAMVERVLSATA